MFDQAVNSQFELKKNESTSKDLLAEVDWNDLSSKAEKASEKDVKMLGDNLRSNWTEIGSVAKVACQQMAATTKLGDHHHDSKGEAKAEGPIRLGNQLVGELSLTSVIKKVEQVGTDVWSWLAGDNSKVARNGKDNQGGKDLLPRANPLEKSEGQTDELEQEPLVLSAFKDTTPDKLRQIWTTVFGDSNMETALALFPSALVKQESILFQDGKKEKSEKSKEQSSEKDNALTAPTGKDGIYGAELKVYGQKVEYIDKTKKVKVTTDGGGQVKAEVKNDNGQTCNIIGNTDGGRAVEIDGKKILSVGRDGAFKAGDLVSDGKQLRKIKDGLVLMQCSGDAISEFFKNLTVRADLGSSSPEQALARLRAEQPDFKPDNAYLIQYLGGYALFHPSLGSFINFHKNEAGELELKYELGDGKHLLRSPSGDLYIVDEKDNSTKKLTAEQKKELMESLGVKAEIIKKLIEAIGTGAPVTLPDGRQILVDGCSCQLVEPLKPGEEPLKVKITEDGYEIIQGDRRIKFDKNAKLRTESTPEGDTTLKVAPGFDMQTKDFVRKNGTFVLNDFPNTSISDNGEVKLPDGSTIAPNNDVFLANGASIRGGQLFDANGNRIDSATPAPQKVTLDSMVSQFIGLVASLAARGSAASPSDIALLEASMSVVQNFVTFFNATGNSQVANSLQGSMAILKASHGKAQHDLRQTEEDDAQLEQSVRVFLANLEAKSTNQSEKQS